jgi:hypothetical protein
MMNTHKSSKAKLLIGGAAIAAALTFGVAPVFAQPAGGPPGAGGAPGGGAPAGGAARQAGGASNFSAIVGNDPTVANPNASLLSSKYPTFGPDAPMPSSDPRDFSGVWYHQDSLDFQIKVEPYDENRTLPFTPLGKQVMDRRIKSLWDKTPYVNASALCYPAGQSWQMDLNMPFHIFQTKDWINILFQEYHGYWQILMGPKDVSTMPKSYMGNSVAHWDGDTLVVETSGYKQSLWLDVDGTPASADAKLTQRIRKVKTDHWTLEVENTLDDPTFYTRPWTWMRSYDWRPDMVIFSEYNCEEQTGDPGSDPVASSSLIREPKDAAAFDSPLIERNAKDE